LVVPIKEAVLVYRFKRSYKCEIKDCEKNIAIHMITSIMVFRITWWLGQKPLKEFIVLNGGCSLRLNGFSYFTSYP
jgi:hypothetical protein